MDFFFFLCKDKGNRCYAESLCRQNVLCIIVVMIEFHRTVTAVKAESLTNANFSSQNLSFLFFSFFFFLIYVFCRLWLQEDELCPGCLSLLFLGKIKIKKKKNYSVTTPVIMKSWLPHWSNWLVSQSRRLKILTLTVNGGQMRFLKQLIKP